MRTENKVKFVFIFCILLLSVIFINTIHATYQTSTQLSQERNNLQNELDGYTETITNTYSQVCDVRNEINKTKTNLSKTSRVVELYESNEKYELHYPSSYEVMKFLYTDETSNKKYNDDTFCCVHYSLEINNKANSNGMVCGLVIVYLSGGESHAIIVFNTTDKGLLFIEPQSDEKVNLEVGKDYWTGCVIKRSNRYYYLGNIDNIVEGYEIYW